MLPCFTAIGKFGTFKNPFALITCLSDFGLMNYKVYSVGTKKRSDFYELQQQYEQLKTMEVNEAKTDTFDEGYINQFQPETNHKLPKQLQRHPY